MADEKKNEETVDEGLVGGTRQEKQVPTEDHGGGSDPRDSTPIGDGPSGGGDNPTPEHT